MPTRRLATIRSHDGTAWSDPLLMGADGKMYRVWYTHNAKTWSPDDLPDLAPPAPTSLDCTNLGQTVRTINMSWNAVSGAESYILRSKYWDLTSTTTSKTGISLGEGATVAMTVHAVKGGIEGPPSNNFTVIAGYEEKSIAASTGYVSGGVQSANRWRQNQWGYGGSNQPYIGWYSTESYRYHAFIELSSALLRNAIVAKYPSLNGHWNSITCTGAGIFFARNGAVGNYNSAYTIQVSLGSGIAYANTAEPPQQANVFDFVVRPQDEGRVGYSMPPNWFQAIYQEHGGGGYGPYNGLLFRPYRNDGGRQEYMAFDTANMVYDMSLSWPKIVTQAQTMTRKG